MAGFTIAPYSLRDFEPVVRLLQDCLPLEPIMPESFARRVLLDVNFDPQGALVAKDGDDAVVGFLLALDRKVSLEDAPPDSDKGWITLFAVTPSARRHRLGSRLLQQAEDWLRARQRKTVLISPYAPGYWTPGVDEAAYPEALAWLQKRGYVTAARPLSMQAELDADWNYPETTEAHLRQQAEQGLRILSFSPEWIPALADFLRREFPGDWQRHIRETIHEILKGYRPSEELWLAVCEQERIIGFAHSEKERFGPIGVADSERGKGVGALLMAQTMQAMRSRGMACAWFLWTNDATAERFYRPAGFKEARRFALLKKSL